MDGAPSLASLRLQEDSVLARLASVRGELDAYASRAAHANARLELYERTASANAPFRALTETGALHGDPRAPLRDEETSLMRQGERLRRAIEARGIRRELPLLDDVRIASPCHARWSDMVGDHRVRHCGSCDKKVYNLSQMTNDEARALLDVSSDLCIRLYRRDDGTVLTQDCPAGKRRQLLRRVGIGAAAIGILLAGGLTVAENLCSKKVMESGQGTMAEFR